MGKMIRYMRLVFLCLLAVACCTPAWASPAETTIVFTGNSFGEYRPCPTCGSGALGGLGRRGGYFARVRGEDPGAVFLSAGYEFGSYIKRRRLASELIEPLAEAYGLLGYDFGLLMPTEAQALAGEGVAPPAGFAEVGAHVATRVLERAGRKLGIVVFPAKADAYAPAGDSLRGDVVDAARALRPSVDMVIGVSPWGERDELAFAKAFPGVLDVVLGAGPGTGYGVRAMGQTLVVRPPFDGRGVVRLDLLSRPEAGQAWREGGEYTFKVLQLGSETAEDVRISNLFSWF